jgi:hypothetical protein
VNKLDPVIIQEYVNQKLSELHQLRIDSIKEIDFNSLLKLDSYLFKARDKFVTWKVISTLLDEYLAISEEKFYEDFFKDLVVFIVEKVHGGCEASIDGLDLELNKDGVHYLVTIKLGPRWVSGSEQGKIEQKLKIAEEIIKHKKLGINVQSVLGICFGKSKYSSQRGYLYLVGRDFWQLVSDDENLYADVIGPIDGRLREKDDIYHQEKSKAENRFTRQFVDEFCNVDGSIDWPKLVEFNSGNFDLDRFLP